jgi:hypothetical protein
MYRFDTLQIVFSFKIYPTCFGACFAPSSGVSLNQISCLVGLLLGMSYSCCSVVLFVSSLPHCRDSLLVSVPRVCNHSYSLCFSAIILSIYMSSDSRHNQFACIKLFIGHIVKQFRTQYMLESKVTGVNAYILKYPIGLIHIIKISGD